MLEYKVKVYANGDKAWYRRGELHCEHWPAVEWADGSKSWYRRGELHCEHGPAIERASGYKAWYLDGKKLTEAEWEERMIKPCSGKVVEIDGVQYKLVEV